MQVFLYFVGKVVWEAEEEEEYHQQMRETVLFALNALANLSYLCMCMHCKGCCLILAELPTATQSKSSNNLYNAVYLLSVALSCKKMTQAARFEQFLSRMTPLYRLDDTRFKFAGRRLH